jgi:Tfp pilus assembly protein PilF
MKKQLGIALGCLLLASCVTVPLKPTEAVTPINTPEIASAPPQDESAATKVEKAKQGLLNSDMKVAEENARAALAIDPKNVEARLMMARVFYAQGKFEAARMVAQDTLTQGSDDAALHLWLAHSLRRLGERDEALAEYQKAATLVANLAEAFDNMGLLMLDRGELDKAREALETTVKLLPQSAPAHMHLGNAQLLLKQFDLANTSYQEALRLDEKLYATYFNLGLLYLTGELKDMDELKRLSSASHSFGSYLDKGEPDQETKKRVEGYVATLKQKILIETQRRERAKEEKLKEEEKQREEKLQQEKQELIQEAPAPSEPVENKPDEQILPQP